MISVKNLTKMYGDFKAVDDLSFELEENKVYGFLGPNGAGKSTTMNIITGCLSATSGEVSIAGFDIFEQPKEAKRCIGYLPEIPPLYIDETVTEYLSFVAKAKGIKKAQLKDEVNRVIEKAGLENFRHKLIKQLSKGYRQRVGIAQAILGTPKIIILDEPTVGLDPEQIIEIRNLVKDLGKEHTVLLSSHILSEVQAVCEKVIIITKGKMIAFDEPESITKYINGNVDFEEAFIELTRAAAEKTAAENPAEKSGQGNKGAEEISAKDESAAAQTEEKKEDSTCEQ